MSCHASRDEAQRSVAGQENGMIPETFRRAKVLIVDDEPAMVRLLEQLLEREGYTNLKATVDPREVLACYAAFQPDLILLDLRMPHVSGLQVLARLKQQTAAEPYLPVLILTADAAAETKRRALAAGASDFVTKPFDPTELLLRVRNLLEMRFLHQELRRQNEGLEAQVHERTHQLLQTEKLATMGNLLAGVAHELNSPLSVILGRVALFEAAAPDERARECAQGIGEAAERCVRIVRSFLTMARRHPPERDHVALSQVLQDAAELPAVLQHQARRRGGGAGPRADPRHRGGARGRDPARGPAGRRGPVAHRAANGRRAGDPRRPRSARRGAAGAGQEHARGRRR